MKDKVKYTDEPMQFRVIPDFLPPPSQLVFKDDAVKVTLSLSTRSVHFFKSEAAKHGVQYQRMIRSLLDAYVQAFAHGVEPERNRAGRGTEEPRRGYRVTAKRRRKAT
jgi:hypothetical protein